MPQITILKPDYYDTFTCIAGKCRNNCCNHPWAIPIDKRTYKTLKSINKPKEFVEAIHNGAIKRIPGSSNRLAYAKITQTQDEEKPWIARCSFQDENGLCKIHSYLGEEHLPRTCQSYPRFTNQYAPRILERGMVMSCEQVANILYGKKTPILFVNEVIEDNKNQLIKKIVGVKRVLDCSNTTLKEYYPLFKSVGIAILQNRDYSFEDRMILLGIFCKKLDDLKGCTSPLEIEQEVNNFIANINAKAYDKVLKAHSNYEIQLQIVYHMLSEFFSKNINQALLSRILHAFGVNLNHDIENNKIQLKLNLHGTIYQSLLKNYETFMADKQHFLENIFVNEFHNQMMPFVGDSFLDSYLWFASNYILLRFMIAGSLGTEQELSKEELIDVVAYYGKIAIHHSQKIEIVSEFLKINNMHSLAHMIMLLKS